MGEVTVLSDDELRFAFIRTFQLETPRSAQTRIGASDLCDRCDRCLAMKMRGINRSSPQAERPWLGKEWGTAGHGHAENNLNRIMAWQDDDSLPADLRAKAAARVLATFGWPEGTRAERRLKVCDIPGYGPVYGTIDLDLPEQIGDIKGSDRMKSAITQDFLAQARGIETRRWVKQKDTARYSGGYKLNLGSDKYAMLSNAKYQAKMEACVYKMDGYFGQQSLYMHGRLLEGRPVTRGSIIWVNRDGNGWFDEPGADGYDDPTKNRDVWILSFDYNHAYAEALIARGADIFARLEAGSAFADFPQSDLCYACSWEEREVPDLELTLPTAA